MIDLYLKFKDEEEMHSTFSMHDLSFNHELVKASHRHMLFEVGEIIGVNGWHVNIRVLDASLDLSGLEEYRVYPSSPSYVWA